MFLVIFFSIPGTGQYSTQSDVCIKGFINLGRRKQIALRQDDQGVTQALISTLYLFGCVHMFANRVFFRIKSQTRVNTAIVSNFVRTCTCTTTSLFPVGHSSIKIYAFHVTSRHHKISLNSRYHVFDSRNGYSSVILINLPIFGFLVILLAKYT